MGVVMPLSWTKLPYDVQQQILDDPALEAAFWQREWELLSSDDHYAATMYYFKNYATYVPATGGERRLLSPDMWPFQWRIVEAMARGEDIDMGKARRSTWTTLAMNYICFVGRFRKAANNSGAAMISKQMGAAKKLIKHKNYGAKAIFASWPKPFRPTYEEVNTTTLVLKETGFKIESYPANESARGDAYYILLWDEMAHAEKGIDPKEIGAAIFPAGEGDPPSQKLVGSTGKGRIGQGEYFYNRFTRSWEGISGRTAIFIPWYDREDRLSPEEWKAYIEEDKIPDRDTNVWYQKTLIDDFDGDPVLMAQEYPASPGEMFAGYDVGVAFSPAGIDAAVELGKKYDAMLLRGIGTEPGQLPPPKGGAVEIGIDWMDYTAVVVLYPLAGNRWYIADERITQGEDAESASKEAVRLANMYGPLDRACYDAAGKQQMASFVVVKPPSTSIFKSVFSKVKRGTVDYMRMLFRRTMEGEEIEIIGISERCPRLTAQLRQIKQKADGSLEKGDDHLVDALIAVMAPRWNGWRANRVR